MVERVGAAAIVSAPGLGLERNFMGVRMTEHEETVYPPIPSPAADTVELDSALLCDIQAGSRSALAQLYDRYADRLLGCAFRILKHRGDAEDLLHDVFLEVWHCAGSYDSARGSVSTWLMLRLRSRAIDRLRVLTVARKRALAGIAPDESPAPPSSDPSLATEHRSVKQAVMALSDVQRTVVELGYFEGLTCAEIAVHCEVPIGTVKSRLAAALAKLRQSFAEHGDTDDAA